MVSSSSRQRESQQSISLWPCDLHKNEEWRTSTSRTLHIKSFPLWRSQFFCLRTSRPGLLFLHRRLGQNQIACLHREARVPRGSGARLHRLRFLVMWLRVSQETRNLNTPPPQLTPRHFDGNTSADETEGETEDKFNRDQQVLFPQKRFILTAERYGETV